nr:PREDICTED: tumor necrosis factor receptor superfamily member 11A-like [Latimeria chalumnae]|eukprot:XP_014354526.1 PREDICTED: tumor necrosis factor receptor superfamily member 11A-like [Latimeria chalumnae]
MVTAVFAVLVLTVGIFAGLVYCRKNGKCLSAELQYRFNEAWCKNQETNSRDPVCNMKPTVNICETSEESYLLICGEKVPSQETSCPNAQAVCEGQMVAGSHSKSEQSTVEKTPSLSSWPKMATAAAKHYPGRIPMEDEYIEGHLQFTHLCQSEFQSGPHVLEPVENEEGINFSQHVSGVQNNTSEECCDSCASCEPDYINSSNRLPQGTSQCTHCSEAFGSLHTDSRTSSHNENTTQCCTSIIPSSDQDSENNCTLATCTYPAESIETFQCTYGRRSKNAAYSLSLDDTGEHKAFDSAGEKYSSNAKPCNTGEASSNSYTEDNPTTDGSVPGNSTTTFISSGQVMNFNGEVIVVYFNQNVNDGPIFSNRTEENLGCPVQEEFHNHSDGFVGDEQQSEMNQTETTLRYGLQDDEPSCTETVPNSPRCFAQENHDCQKMTFYNSTAPLPVQEEGKSDHLSKEERNFIK